MSNFNKVYLMGHLTRDVELKYTQNGTAYGKTGIAVNRKFTPKDGGETKEEVCYVDLTAWGKSAETLSQYVKKGSPLFVEGRLVLNQWETDAGEKRSKLEVTVETFQFLRTDNGSAGSQASGGKRRSATAEKVADQVGGEVEDGIPF